MNTDQGRKWSHDHCLLSAIVMLYTATAERILSIDRSHYFNSTEEHTINWKHFHDL